MIDSLIEVTLESRDDFLKVKETLTRIGIASNKDRKLYQSCHILHKRGNYYIVHFKELFALDGRAATLDESDIARRNSIARLLQEWGLCNIVGKEGDTYPSKMQVFCPYNKIKILSFDEKDSWELVSKYSIGKKKF
jgi:hypothetical protein